MTPERWRQVKEVFQELVEVSATEHAARLAQLDDELRREVVALLAAATTGAQDFLEVPAAHSFDEDDGRIGRRVGPWRIVEELGRGGMGAVYLARREDQEVKGEVALKVVKRGMDTDVVLRRFRAERQILAGLSHPNIARLLDAGSTDDGTPWFAMELVRGEPIDRHCARRELDLDARIGLFTTVCGAVHHAHQNLIVHRDLKPSNILVTADGRPVLLDFGIAKLLDPEADATATEHAVMTPAYASPEQLAGKVVTTASDVYSLGVLLFELLTSSRPYEVSSAHALHQTLARGEVPAASVALARSGKDPRGVRRLRGDLDAIVAMAMKPAPEARYASPRELAQDLEAYLEGRPTVARREGVAGRTWKLIRRHRVVSAAIVAVVIALVGGVVATTRQARIAEAERARAERRSDEVRRLAGRVLFDLHDAIADLPGSTAARALLVQESRTYLESLALEARERPDLLIELSQAWLRLGDVQGNAGNANLGEHEAARTSYVRALEIAEHALALAPTSRAARLAVAAARNRAGDMKWEDGDLAGSAAIFEHVISDLRALVAADPGDHEAQHLLAQSVSDLGDGLRKVEPARAFALYDEARAIEEALMAAPAKPTVAGDDVRIARTLSVILNKLARIAVEEGDRPTALARYQKSLAIRERLLARAPTSAGARRDLSTSLTFVGKLLLADGGRRRRLSFRRRCAVRGAGAGGRAGRMGLCLRPSLRQPQGADQGSAEGGPRYPVRHRLAGHPAARICLPHRPGEDLHSAAVDGRTAAAAGRARHRRAGGDRLPHEARRRRDRALGRI